MRHRLAAARRHGERRVEVRLLPRVRPIPAQRNRPGKLGISSVNESFSKRFEFSENSRGIRFECAQKPEQASSTLSVSVCHAATSQQPLHGARASTPEGIEQGYRTHVLSACASRSGSPSCWRCCHPAAARSRSAQAKVGATDAVVAAGAAVSDMSSFCDRQPEACVVGAQAAVAIGQRAQAGAKMVYDFVSERTIRTAATRAWRQDRLGHAAQARGGRRAGCRPRRTRSRRPTSNPPGRARRLQSAPKLCRCRGKLRTARPDGLPSFSFDDARPQPYITGVGRTLGAPSLDKP